MTKTERLLYFIKSERDSTNQSEKNKDLTNQNKVLSQVKKTNEDQAKLLVCLQEQVSNT